MYGFVCGYVVVKRPYIERLLIQPNSTQFGKLNLIPNPQTEKDGGRVDIIKSTHIVVQFFGNCLWSVMLKVPC